MLEIELGISAMGGSVLIGTGSRGGAMDIATSTATVAWPLIVDGVIKVGHGTSLFRKKSKDSSYDHNLDPQHKGTPRTNPAQNTQAKGARRKIEHEIGRKLNKQEKEILHRAIHGQNYGYWEIVEEGIALFKK